MYEQGICSDTMVNVLVHFAKVGVVAEGFSGGRVEAKSVLCPTS